MHLNRATVVGLFTLAPLFAQSPKFDIVSIRPIPPNAPPTLREIDFTPVLPGGPFVDARINLISLISFAYQVEDPDIRLTGLPAWTRNRSWAISAKPAEGFPALPPAQNREQVRLMLRAMLEDRFHLQLHTEDRHGPIYKLEVAKGGFRIPEVDPPQPPAKEAPVGAAMGDDRGRMIGNKSTMASLARALVIFLKRPVVDQTGLKGYYDFDIRWTAPERDGAPPASRLGPDGIGMLISNLQSQLGLRLTSATGPVKYWVVDHADPPAEN